MRISDAQAARFYAIWWELLNWVNAERAIVRVLARHAAGAICIEHAAPIREVVWQDMSLLERFVAENPANRNRSGPQLRPGSGCATREA